MNEVAGQKVAEMLPKMLLKMMGALMENGIKSWQIYDNKYSIDLRIRFDHECKAMAASSEFVYKQGSEADTRSTPIHTQPASYHRKPPSHIKRDMNRRIARAKRQRLEDSDEIENERLDELKETIDSCISPECICEPPYEDTLVLSPVLPISIDFGSLKRYQFDNCEENFHYREPERKLPEVGFKCPNCDEVMENVSHVCSEVTKATEEDAISENKIETTSAQSSDEEEKENDGEPLHNSMHNDLRERMKERLRQLEMMKENFDNT